MVKNLKRTLALMLSIIMIFSSTLMTYANDEGIITGGEAETSAQVEETVAAEAETSTKAPEAEAATQQTQAAPAAEAVEAVKPEITGQPEDAAVRLNDEAVFSLETNGQVKSCQWQTAKTKGGVWSNLNRREYGSSETLKIRAVKKYDKRFFRCIVTFKDGTTAKSDEARLSIVENESFPAQNFGSVKDTKVVAPEGAFPAGTTMEAEEVEDTAAVQAIIDGMDDVDGSVLNAVDISFYNGGEIQPKEAVKVTMNVGKDVDFDNLVLVHINADADQLQKDNLKTETVDFTYDKEAGTITFDADSFSTYTLIDTVVILDSEGSFDFDTADYKVTVSYTKEAGIPVGTELTVSQIPYDSEEYWNLWNQSLEKINENATWEEGSEIVPDTRRGIASAAFFDISLMDGDKEIEPEIPLQVEIKLKNGGLPLFDGQDVEVIHFGEVKADGTDGTELIDDVQVGEAGVLAGGMPVGVAVDSFAFEQTGFSVSGTITTDDHINFDAAEYAGSYEDVNNMASKMLLAATRAAGDPTINAGKTVTDNNSDGIYELALSINATSKQSSTTQVTKSNVVMVIDVSGSMGNSDSWIYYDTYTYDQSTYDQFRYYSSSTSMSTRLYFGTYYRWENRRWVEAGTGWYSGNQYGGTAYSGTVYAYETRLHATQRAACAVVDALMAKNQNADGITDLFELTLIKFAGTGQTSVVSYDGTEIKDKTDATLIKNGINSLTANGGTNWEAALNLAKTEADYYKNTDTSTKPDNPENTSVIFLTDGFPTYYVNDNGGQSGNGGESDSNIATSYTQARPSARTIVSSGYTLYNIFAFGSDTTTYNNHTGFAYLRALTNYAYGTGNTDNYDETDLTRQYAFNAKSTQDLVNAFETIINHITNNVGYAGVNLTDGVSLGATSTSVAVNGTAKAETMRYTVKDASDKLAYTVTINSSGAATFTIYNSDGSTTTLTDNEPEPVSTTINGTTITTNVYSVKNGTGDDAPTYKMAPATIDASTGMVTWNLAGLGILESGYTYTVAFDVWPKQVSYDICADLNNGIYSSVDAAIAAYGVPEAERQHVKDALVHNADGSYSLKTNYSQQVEYYPATSQTDDSGDVTWTYGNKQTQQLLEPDPIPLQGSLIPMAKVWESNLALSELNELLWEGGVVGGTSKEYQITLYLWKAETKSAVQALATANNPADAYITKVLGWETHVGEDGQEVGEYNFEKDAAVAPGTMVNLTEAAKLGFDTTDTSKIKTFTNSAGTTLQYYVIEEGHYYMVTEAAGDLHFELNAPIYHPMIVDGTLYNVGFGEGQTVEIMDPMYGVVATNTLKGGLNIHKKVSSSQIPSTFKKIQVPKYENGKIVKDEETGDPVMIEVDDVDYTPVADCEDEFAYKITIWKVDDQNAIQPVYTFDDQFKSDGVTATSGSIGYRELGVGEDGKSVTLGRNVILFENSTNAAEKIAANKVGDNDPVYATLTSDNKTQIILRMPANGEIRLVNLPSGTKYTVEEIIDPAGAYTFAATKSEIKYDDENIEYVSVGTTNGVSGSVKGNTANLETFYNWAANFYVYHSSDNMVEKISFADERVKGTYDATDGYSYSFNIVDETKGDLLYGGYYKAYRYADKTDAEIIAATYTKDSSGKYWYKDEAGEGYDATVANVWVKNEAYTATVGLTGGGKGTEMSPKANIVYYLKEVPNGYIRPYIHFTYDEVSPSKALKKLYVITATDDTNYTSAGYIITPAKTQTDAKTRSLSISIKKSDGTLDTILTAKKIWTAKSYHNESVTLTRGYLYWSDFSDQIGKGFTFRPCWTTLDGVLVKGVTVREVNNGTCYTDGTGTVIDVTDTKGD